MPRRRYSDLGYTVRRLRHVWPEGQERRLVDLAKLNHVELAVMVDLIVAEWLGWTSGPAHDEMSNLTEAGKAKTAELVKVS